MNRNELWRSAYRIRSYDVDLFGEARPQVSMSILLDSAWAHANQTEFSYDALRREGQFWVLSRFLAEVYRPPQWDEEVVIETWGKGTDRLFALRDYEVFSPSGEKLIGAASSWLILDRTSLRPQRLDKLKETFPHLLDRNAITTPLEKIPEQPTREPAAHYRVLFSDIDVNLHLNSSKYVEWITDSFPAAQLQTKRVSSFEVNYLAEAQMGDDVSVCLENEGERFSCEVRRERDNAVLCRARLRWGDRAGRVAHTKKIQNSDV